MNLLFPLARHSGISETLAPFVQNMARTFNAHIHLLRVEELSDQYVEKRVQDAQNWVHEFAVAHINPKCSMAIEADVVIGDPAEEILKYIEQNNIDCVIIGTCKKKTTERFLFGSTAKAIVGRSTIPVLTINPHTLTDAFLKRNAQFFQETFCDRSLSK